MGIFMDYIGAAVFYNLQILPETLMTRIIVLAILIYVICEGGGER